METLGSELVLLAIDPRNGRVQVESNLRYGLMGAELVRLAASGRIDIRGDRIVVIDPASTTGDSQLDAALASIAGARRQLKPSVWVGRPRPQIVNSYLGDMAAAGVIARTGGWRPRWQVVDQAALASVRAKLDAVASGPGYVDMEQAALAGLVHATRLDHVLYPGRGNRSVHQRFQQVGSGNWTSAAVEKAVAASANAAQQAAIHAATQAAMQAATQAATDAAIAASITTAAT